MSGGKLSEKVTLTYKELVRSHHIQCFCSVSGSAGPLRREENQADGRTRRRCCRRSAEKLLRPHTQMFGVFFFFSSSLPSLW